MPTEERDEVEVEFLPGLASFVLDEIDELFGGVAIATRVTSAACRLAFTSDAVDRRRCLRLRTAVAVNLVQHFDVPRPKALLGDATFRDVVALLERAMSWSARGEFRSFRITAAGRDSSVFERVSDEIARASGLEFDPRFGDLLVGIRRAGEGWDVAARTTPLPLATRAWRKHNYRGALNATIAAAMVRLLPSAPSFLNLMCGSGTLLAEHVAARATGFAIGLDDDRSVIDLARDHAPRAALVVADAQRTPFASGSFGALAADLPYGQAVGSHAENEGLYAAVVREAARIATGDAFFAVITHDIRRFRRVLDAQASWSVEREAQVFQKGHNPFVWLLSRQVS